MGKGLQRVAATCGGLTAKANGKTVKYGANGKPSKRAVNVGSLKRAGWTAGMVCRDCGKRDMVTTYKPSELMALLHLEWFAREEWICLRCGHIWKKRSNEKLSEPGAKT